eukprot:2391374-Rhodomonas_salina.2
MASDSSWQRVNGVSIAGGTAHAEADRPWNQMQATALLEKNSTRKGSCTCSISNFSTADLKHPA